MEEAYFFWALCPTVPTGEENLAWSAARAQGKERVKLIVTQNL
jgi:hypothetical protein